MAKYSKSTGKDVERAMKRRQYGKLKSGQRGKGGTVKPTGHRHGPFRGAREGQESAQAQNGKAVDPMPGKRVHLDTVVLEACTARRQRQGFRNSRTRLSPTS